MAVLDRLWWLVVVFAVCCHAFVDEDTTIEERTDAMTARCRANCLKKFNPTEQYGTCFDGDDCNTCWNTCKQLADNKTLWTFACDQKEHCAYGCSESCRFYQTNSELIEATRTDSRFTTPLGYRVVFGRAVTFEWSSPEGNGGFDPLVYVFTVWRRSSSMPHSRLRFLRSMSSASSSATTSRRRRRTRASWSPWTRLSRQTFERHLTLRRNLFDDTPNAHCGDDADGNEPAPGGLTTEGVPRRWDVSARVRLTAYDSSGRVAEIDTPFARLKRLDCPPAVGERDNASSPLAGPQGERDASALASRGDNNGGSRDDNSGDSRGDHAGHRGDNNDGSRGASKDGSRDRGVVVVQWAAAGGRGDAEENYQDDDSGEINRNWTPELVALDVPDAQNGGSAAVVAHVRWLPVVVVGIPAATDDNDTVNVDINTIVGDDDSANGDDANGDGENDRGTGGNRPALAMSAAAVASPGVERASYEVEWRSVDRGSIDVAGHVVTGSAAEAQLPLWPGSVFQVVVRAFISENVATAADAASSPTTGEAGASIAAASKAASRPYAVTVRRRLVAISQTLFINSSSLSSSLPSPSSPSSSSSSKMSSSSFSSSSSWSRESLSNDLPTLTSATNTAYGRFDGSPGSSAAGPARASLPLSAEVDDSQYGSSGVLAESTFTVAAPAARGFLARARAGDAARAQADEAAAVLTFVVALVSLMISVPLLAMRVFVVLRRRYRDSRHSHSRLLHDAHVERDSGLRRRPLLHSGPADHGTPAGGAPPVVGLSSDWTAPTGASAFAGGSAALPTSQPGAPYILQIGRGSRLVFGGEAFGAASQYRHQQLVNEVVDKQGTAYGNPLWFARSWRTPIAATATTTGTTSAKSGAPRPDVV